MGSPLPAPEQPADLGSSGRVPGTAPALIKIDFSEGLGTVPAAAGAPGEGEQGCSLGSTVGSGSWVQCHRAWWDLSPCTGEDEVWGGRSSLPGAPLSQRARVRMSRVSGPSKAARLWFFCLLGQSPATPLSCCFINTAWPTCLAHGTQCPAWCLRGHTLRKWSRWESGGALSSQSWPLGRGCCKGGPKSTGLGVLARAHLGSGWRSPCCEPVGRPPGLAGRGLRRAFLPCTRLSYPHLLCLLARLRVGGVRVPA